MWRLRPTHVLATWKITSMALWTPALFALELLTIASNVNLDWSILHKILMRVFNSLMASSLLLVMRTKQHICAHTISWDCALSPTLCALSSHRLQYSSRLEHLTVYDVAHFSFADDTFHTDRLEVLRFSSAHIDILDCTPSPTLYALASRHCLQCSSSLEHSTAHHIAHSSFDDGNFHAARFEVRGIFKCAHQYLGLSFIWHFLRPS